MLQSQKMNGRSLTCRLVDKFVTQHRSTHRVPCHTEAGVPLVRNTEVAGLQETNCERDKKQDKNTKTLD